MPLTAAEVLSAGINPPVQEMDVTPPHSSSPQTPSLESAKDVLLEALAGPKLASDTDMKLEANEVLTFQQEQRENVETETEAAGALLVLTGNNGKLSHNQVEHNRRLRAKQLFDELRQILPGGSDNGKFKDRNALLQIAVDVLRAAECKDEMGSEDEVKVESESNPSEPEVESRSGLYCEILAGGQAWEGLPDGDTKGDGEDGEKKLSHSEAEQRRRLMARNFYNELRNLLPGPDTERLDKNAILQRTIERLKEVAAAAADETTQKEVELQGGLAAVLSDKVNRTNLSQSPPDVVLGMLNLVASRSKHTSAALGTPPLRPKAIPVKPSSSTPTLTRAAHGGGGSDALPAMERLPAVQRVRKTALQTRKELPSPEPRRADGFDTTMADEDEELGNTHKRMHTEGHESGHLPHGV